MTFPGPDELQRLLGWTPEGGVLSVYVAVDPADRGGGWHVALGDELRDVVGGAEATSHDRRLALRAVTDAVLRRFPEQGKLPEGRGHIGFIEVARKGREQWYTSQMPPRRTQAAYGHRPYLRPLIEIADEGARIGVAAVSGDQVRVWEWELGVLSSELGDWTLTTTGDWRERKAQRPSDPARVHGAKASGREQHEQRLEANRERFLKQAGGRTEALAAQREWRELIVLGENEHLRRYTGALDPHRLRHALGKNVVSQPSSRIAERVEELLSGLNRERELRLVEAVKESAYSGRARGSLGPQETLEALNEGRVEHLLFDAERDYRGHGIEEALAYEGPPLGGEGLPVTELMIERALETAARITPLEGDAARALDEHGGVAALLRY